MLSSELARYLDHTLLLPEATHQQIEELCDTARKLNVFAVCVNPTLAGYAVSHLGRSLSFDLPDSKIKVASVVGYPTGAHETQIKSYETSLAVEAGANEIDMVINLGDVLEGNWSLVENDIAAVRGSCEAQLLKVIFETAVLNDEQIRTLCKVSEAAGADYVKTSTGVHPAGGATIHAVELMKETLENRLGIKASGGIRTAEQALAFIGAGATRLGTSVSAQILSDPILG